MRALLLTGFRDPVHPVHPELNRPNKGSRACSNLLNVADAVKLNDTLSGLHTGDEEARWQLVIYISVSELVVVAAGRGLTDYFGAVRRRTWTLERHKVGQGWRSTDAGGRDHRQDGRIDRCF